MATMINMTPHPINICDPAQIRFNKDIRKWIADGPEAIIKSIPSMGILNARISTNEGPSLDGIPTFGKVIEGCDPLPEDAPDDAIFIVSALYASAYIKQGGDPDRIMLVADPVTTPDGKTFIGCRGLAAPF